MTAVTVTIPYWKSRETIRRTVESVLAQTHRDLICVVINDGDGEPPWDLLAAVDDPRLVFFDLPDNQGRYFADAVAARACLTDWWTPHDADDWSEPHRLAALLAAASEETDAVFAPFTNHYESGRVVHRPIRGRTPERRLRYTAHLSGLWRPAFAAHLTHPGYRVAYDAVMTTAALYYGRIAQVSDASYHRVRRAGSLVTNPATGAGTPYRRQVKRKLRRLWRSIDTGARTIHDVGRIIAADTDPVLGAEVAEHADRLKALLSERRLA